MAETRKANESTVATVPEGTRAPSPPAKTHGCDPAPVKFIHKGKTYWIPAHVVDSCDCPRDLIDYIKECESDCASGDEEDLSAMDRATRHYEESRM